MTNRHTGAGGGVERTEAGRYIAAGGTRWRATDPSIPENLHAELVRALMTGRREVRSRGDAARVMVSDAKVALGERGDPWWEPTEEGIRQRLAATIRTLLRARGKGSMCPSEAARVAGGDHWRELMATARAVAFELRDERVVAVTQRGERITGSEGLDRSGSSRMSVWNSRRCGSDHSPSDGLENGWVRPHSCMLLTSRITPTPRPAPPPAR